MNSLTIACKVKRCDFKNVGNYALTELNVVWAKKKVKPDKNGKEWDNVCAVV